MFRVMISLYLGFELVLGLGLGKFMLKITVMISFMVSVKLWPIVRVMISFSKS